MKLLEHYVSTQGEGPRTGTLTQFVRFAGCNLRCPGWPCDTQRAIEPKLYIGKYENVTANTLTGRLIEMRDQTGASNICITGGEPFLQPFDEMEHLSSLMFHEGFDQEVFTNGTLVIPTIWFAYAQVNMDWKLAGSGEGHVGHDQRLRNVRFLKPSDMIKFVVKDEADIEEAVAATDMLRTAGFMGEFWVGAAWDEITPARLVAHIIAEALPWKLNVQVHKYVWDPERTLV